jgi:glycerol kinase
VVFGETDLNGLLPKRVPIAGVIGDSHGALVGQTCFDAGMGKATYGTGTSVMFNIGRQPLLPPDGLVTTIGFAALGEVYYALEGNIHCTGDAIHWLVNEMGVLSSPAESEELATAIPDNHGVYFVPAFAGLGAPWWDNEARALICGMDRGTDKRHIARAALEAIAYQVKDLVDVMMKSAGLSLSGLRVDGGGAANKFLVQFQADMLQVPVSANPIQEASAYGAVMMNALALGRRKSLESLLLVRGGEHVVLPVMSSGERERLYAGWRKAIALIHTI